MRINIVSEDTLERPNLVQYIFVYFFNGCSHISKYHNC